MRNQEDAARYLSFGGFRFDCQSHQLYHGESEIKLRDADAEMLKRLVVARGCLVRRAGLWANENGLNDAVWRVRKGMLDAMTAEEKRELPEEAQEIIGCRSGFGYQLLLPVRESPGSTRESSASGDPAQTGSDDRSNPGGPSIGRPINLIYAPSIRVENNPTITFNVPISTPGESDDPPPSSERPNRKSRG